MPRPLSIAKRDSSYLSLGVVNVENRCIVTKNQLIRLGALLSMLFVSACGGATSSSGAAAPTAAVALDDACGVADRFLKGWEADDYPTMYGLLSARSLQISQTQFNASYSNADSQMGKPAKSHLLNCGDATLQGTTAAILYDMTFKGTVLGEFTDPRRTVRLVWTPHGWRVAWSTMDIFEGMAGGATLQLSYTPATRGRILDRKGNPLAEDNQTLYTVTLATEKYPRKPADCFYEIADLFKRKITEVTASYKGLTGLQYGEYIGHLDQATYTAKRAQLDAVCAVKYAPQTTRVYANNGLAAQTIGYVGAIPADSSADYAEYAPGSLVGLAGIEKAYQKQLAGTTGALLIIQLPDGTRLRTLAGQQAKPSQDVKLTLDRDLQAAAEQAIADAYSFAAPSWAQFSTGAAAIVIDVKTGAILAMASYPTFDVDAFNFNTLIPGATLTTLLNKITAPANQYAHSATLNIATSEYSALGSVFKIISMAAAADSGTFKLNQTYTCTGKWDGTKFGDSRAFRNDWIALDPSFADKGNKHGTITLIQALTSSCDAYFWEVGGTLNKKDSGLLAKYADKLGLGKPTGLSEISELRGQIPSPDNIGKIAITQGRSWEVGDALNEVIGQGDVLVTPIQIAHMMAAIANGGDLYQPYLVQSIGAKDQPPTYQGQPQKQGNIGIDPKVLAGIQQGLCNVTQDKNLGTAQWFMWNWDFSRINVCGKTGTAQSTAHPNGWFAAYAGPAGKPPEIAVVSLVEHGREGSETAGPIVRRIIEAYYGIHFGRPSASDLFFNEDAYNPYPPFWTQPYIEMADPNMTDGGRH